MLESAGVALECALRVVGHVEFRVVGTRAQSLGFCWDRAHLRVYVCLEVRGTSSVVCLDCVR